ncbi:hypothetical protein CRENBAI_023867 [Crenichthys baileyi]|uniref:G-protein coupled receptors family 1 profile domain-containing protein n=1 Tax=Crenichthys baileyi TaxID=28760 RepID=A0AAV9RQ07_9TELE
MEQKNPDKKRGNNTDNCPNIDDFRNQVYSTSYSLITVLGFVGNGFALMVLIKTYRQSTPFHVYMMNLAMSIPVFPVQNLRLVTESRARFVCLGIWIFSSLASSPFLMSGQSIDPITNKTKCFEPPKSASDRLPKLQALNNVALALGFVRPYLIIASPGKVRTCFSHPRARDANQHQKPSNDRSSLLPLPGALAVPHKKAPSPNFPGKSTCSEQTFMHKSVVVTLAAPPIHAFTPHAFFFSRGGRVRSRLPHAPNP